MGQLWDRSSEKNQKNWSTMVKMCHWSITVQRNSCGFSTCRGWWLIKCQGPQWGGYALAPWMPSSTQRLWCGDHRICRDDWGPIASMTMIVSSRSIYSRNLAFSFFQYSSASQVISEGHQPRYIRVLLATFIFSLPVPHDIGGSLR